MTLRQRTAFRQHCYQTFNFGGSAVIVPPLISGLRETKDSTVTTGPDTGYWMLMVTIKMFGL